MAEKKERVDAPVWSGRVGRPRVLVEARVDSWRQTTVDALEDHGYEVIGCAGPKPDQGELCPAIDGGRCPGAAHADVVICDFDAADHHTRSLPTAVAHELREGASVIVLVNPSEADRYQAALEGCQVLHRPVTGEDLMGAVATAVDELVRTPAPLTGDSRPVVWSRPPTH